MLVMQAGNGEAVALEGLLFLLLCFGYWVIYIASPWTRSGKIRVTMSLTKFVLIFFLIINKEIEIAADKVVTGSVPAAVIFLNYRDKKNSVARRLCWFLLIN